jgi:hypothetical protein
MKIPDDVKAQAKQLGRVALAELGSAAKRAVASGVGSALKDIRRSIRQADDRLYEIECNAKRIEEDEQ